MNFEDLSADLVNHAITGYLPRGDYINIPLISHIKDNLYVGGCVHGVELGDHFSHIFSLYKWERYSYDTEKTKLYEYEMYDSHDGVDVDTVEQVSDRIVEALAQGGNVLVHCQAGINRSNLLAASALIKIGYTAEDAIALLREQRSPLVLANHTFENYLLGEKSSR